MLTTKKDLPQVKETVKAKETDYLIKPFKTAQLGMKIVMTLAASDYLTPEVIREELRIRSLPMTMETPVLTDRVGQLKTA